MPLEAYIKSNHYQGHLKRFNSFIIISTVLQALHIYYHIIFAINPMRQILLLPFSNEAAEAQRVNLAKYTGLVKGRAWIQTLAF